jgi:hypothetical protein
MLSASKKRFDFVQNSGVYETVALLKRHCVYTLKNDDKAVPIWLHQSSHYLNMNVGMAPLFGLYSVCFFAVSYACFTLLLSVIL